MIVTLAHVLYSAVLLTVSYTDIRRGIVPNQIMYPALLLAMAGMFRAPGWRSRALGGLVGMVVFIIPILFYGLERAGMGDVKLALFIGLIVGFPTVIYALTITFFSGAIVGLVGIGLGKLTRRSTIPFAPFLALGALVLLWLQ